MTERNKQKSVTFDEQPVIEYMTASVDELRGAQKRAVEIANEVLSKQLKQMQGVCPTCGKIHGCG